MFPYVTDAVKSAEVTRQILSQEVRFDLTVVGHNTKALNKWHELLRTYGIDDITGSQYTEVYSRLKDYLFKENGDAKYSKGSGAVFGHQLPNGKWLYHNLSSTQSSKLRELLRSEEAANYNSFSKLLRRLSLWLSGPQKRFQESLEEGFLVEFPQVILKKRAFSEDDSKESSNKAAKSAQQMPSKTI